MDVAGRSLLVGVDGSPSSELALSWGIAEAARRGLALRVLTVVSSMRQVPPAEALLDLERHVRDMVARLTDGFEVEVETKVVVGKPAATVCAESESADMVVVGSRGLTCFDDLLIGSVAMQVATHAASPVVVVRTRGNEVAPGPSAGRIVVGIDEGDVSLPAVGFAIEEAALRGVGLTAVHVVRDPALTLPDGTGIAPARGRLSSPRWRWKPGWRSRCVIFHLVRRSGTRLSTGCSPTSR